MKTSDVPQPIAITLLMLGDDSLITLQCRRYALCGITSYKYALGTYLYWFICEHNLPRAKPCIFSWLYKLKLLYNMTHVFPPYPQTSHFIHFGQLFILYTVLHDINTNIKSIHTNNMYKFIKYK